MIPAVSAVVPVAGAILAATVSGILNFIGRRTKFNATRFGPCATEQGFALPGADNVCLPEAQQYVMAFFSPVSNPFAPTVAGAYVAPYSTASSGPKAVTDLDLGDFGLYTALVPTSGVKSLLPNVFGLVSKAADGREQALNLCPQCLLADGATSIASACAVPLPLCPGGPGDTINQAATNQNNALWVIPGRSTGPTSANGLNVGVQAPAVYSDNGLATTLFVYATKPTCLYIELGGACGGSVQVFSAVASAYAGGYGGLVHGLYELAAYDVLKICLGSAGEDVQNTTDSMTFEGNGQGGLGTLFGGANGGGASYVVHFPASLNGSGAFSAIQEAFANKPFDGSRSKLVCVAGAGGGSSRNASGGNAGLYTDGTEAYGSAQTKAANGEAYGSQGGKTYQLGRADYQASINTNGFSGGGGSIVTGGQSNVPKPTRPKACYGAKLEPFEGRGSVGAGNVVTDTGSGGGGGGGGYFGGGAGGFNGLAKPNNVHGAGGGGSSWVGLLKPETKQGRRTLNAYRRSTVGIEDPWIREAFYPSSSTQKPGIHGFRDFGFLVLGLPTS